ncbi:hypothetical protein AHiyo8_01370 [Arthrobacter sp. Hiyo8]|nr:hypothetical protein AHiyo8_01370 [Arthrobacter sp. Hiyo8]
MLFPCYLATLIVRSSGASWHCRTNARSWRREERATVLLPLGTGLLPWALQLLLARSADARRPCRHSRAARGFTPCCGYGQCCETTSRCAAQRLVLHLVPAPLDHLFRLGAVVVPRHLIPLPGELCEPRRRGVRAQASSSTSAVRLRCLRPLRGSACSTAPEVGVAPSERTTCTACDPSVHQSSAHQKKRATNSQAALLCRRHHHVTACRSERPQGCLPAAPGRKQCASTRRRFLVSSLAQRAACVGHSPVALCVRGLRPIGSHPDLDTWFEPSRARDGTPAARDRDCFHVPKPVNLSINSSHSRVTAGRIRHRIAHVRARHCRFEAFSPSSAPVRGARLHFGHESAHSWPESARHSTAIDQRFRASPSPGEVGGI